MQMTLSAAILATVISAIVIFLTRLFPFALFSNKEPPALLRFIEKYIPPMIMAILLVYCFNGVSFSTRPYGIPHLIALAVTVITYLWKNNSMVSIFGGTIIFMLLKNL